MKDKTNTKALTEKEKKGFKISPKAKVTLSSYLVFLFLAYHKNQITC